MKINIGKFDPATRTVPVTFTEGGKVHRRPVNAVLDEAGEYDRKGTRARAEEVGAGVSRKFALGLLGSESGE